MRTAGRLATAVGAAIGVVLGADRLTAAPAPCDADMRAFCRGLEHGHGAMQRCMEEHFAALSSACRAHMQREIERAHTSQPREPNAKGRAKKPDE
jgi:hypothetical protein